MHSLLRLVQGRSVLLSGLFLAAACGSDDTGGPAGETTNPTTTPTTGDDVSTTVNPTNGDSTTVDSTTVDSTTEDENDDTTTGDTHDDTTTRGEDETEGSETGHELCAIDLPPPGTCNANAPRPPMQSLLSSATLGLRQTSALAPPQLEMNDDPPTTGGFIDPGEPNPAFECDLWSQSCPVGQKCMPWDNSGQGSWNATRCSPLDPNPAGVGDPCTVEGSGTSGIDNCEIGAMCWGVDTETNMGHCIELCSCSEANPTCETPNTFCSITNSGVLPLCLSVCNPLDPGACGASEGCYPSGQYFVCAPNASTVNAGNAGDPCEFLNVCNHGLMCGTFSMVPGCFGSSGCCTAFCNIGDDSQCLQGQSCLPFYEAGQAPDDCLGDVGVCMVPS